MKYTNKSKGVLVCFLLVLCAVVTVACGKDNQKKAGSSNDDAGGSKGLITVGYVQSGTGSAWSLANVDPYSKIALKKMELILSMNVQKTTLTTSFLLSVHLLNRK